MLDRAGMDADAIAMEGRSQMSGENPAPQDVSQSQVDAALAAAGSAQTNLEGQGTQAVAPSEPSTQADPISSITGDATTSGSSDTATIHEFQSESAIPLDLPDLGTIPSSRTTQGIELLSDVELNVKIELGRATMPIEEVLRLGEGSVVELDKLAGDPVDVLVNDRLVARGEVIVLNDNFCVRISEIVATDSDVAAA